jgi:serine/threonine-protein kinase HipA
MRRGSRTHSPPTSVDGTEHAKLTLARACGLATAESKVVSVGSRDVLLVKRFDRQKTNAGYQRSRMLSALTLLRAEDSPQSREKWSYILFVEQLRLVCAFQGW